MNITRLMEKTYNSLINKLNKRYKSARYNAASY